MTNEPDKDTFVDDIKQYFDTRFKLIVLDIVENGIKAGTKVIFYVVIALMLSLVFILINFGVAYYLGDLLGKIHYGYLLVGGFYLLLSILLMVYKKKIIKKLTDLLADGIFSDDN